MYRLTIGENEAGQRLDRFMRKYLKRAPLSAIYRIIRKDLKVNGRRVKEDQMLQPGDELTFYLSEDEIRDLAKATRPRTPKRQFKIAYEDDHVLIVDKPVGLLTHGDSREKSNTLANQVCGYLQQKGQYDPSKERTFRPAPVNRLDRNTSGLVIFGKNAEALRLLAELLRQRKGVGKFYRTILCGRLDEETVVEEALTKDQSRNIVSVATAQQQQPSVTIARPIIVGDEFTAAEVELLTGRTHQIRVHMSHIGHPLAGDPKYGDPRINVRLKEIGLRTQLLHACRLEFAQYELEGGALSKLAGKVIEAEPPLAFHEAEKKLLRPLEKTEETHSHTIGDPYRRKAGK